MWFIPCQFPSLLLSLFLVQNTRISPWTYTNYQKKLHTILCEL